MNAFSSLICYFMFIFTFWHTYKPSTAYFKLCQVCSMQLWLVNVSLKCEQSLNVFNLIVFHKQWISSGNRFYAPQCTFDFSLAPFPRVSFVLNCSLVRSSSLTRTGWMLSLSYNSVVWHHVSRVKHLIFHNTSKFNTSMVAYIPLTGYRSFSPQVD